MKQTEHLLIGISTGVLFFFNSLSITINTCLLLIAIGIGSVIPDIDGNNIKKYRHNPLIYTLAGINYYLIYPVVKLLFRRKTLKKRELSNVFVIIIISVIFYTVLRLLDMIFIFPFNIKPLFIGILFGGFCNVLAHCSSRDGVTPLYPIWKKKIAGNVEPWNHNEHRIIWLIVVPSILFIFELFIINKSSYSIQFIEKINLIALFLVWVCYLSSARIIHSKTRKIKIKYTRIDAHFHSSIERYNFAELNNERMKRGLCSLQFDNYYAQLSHQHSQTMAKKGKVFHGDNVRMTHGSFSGENCAMMMKGRISGYSHVIRNERDIAKALHRQWMKSPGHRENILNSGYNYVGIGVYRQGHKYYATQLFSS